MIYRISGNVIYSNDTKVGDISYQGTGMRFYQAIFTGPVSFTLERTGRGFRILDSGMDMGKTGRGYTIEYNFQTYRPNSVQLRQFIMSRTNTLEVESGGSTVFTINRTADGFTIDCNDNSSLVPAFAMFSILSQYTIAGGMNTYIQPRALVPPIYRGISTALGFAALIFLFIADTGYIPVFLSYVLFIVLLISSYAVRFAGRASNRKKDN